MADYSELEAKNLEKFSLQKLKRHCKNNQISDYTKDSKRSYMSLSKAHNLTSDDKI